MVDISLSWWEVWYLPPFYMNSSSTLYILVADITANWVLVDCNSIAGQVWLWSVVHTVMSSGGVKIFSARNSNCTSGGTSLHICKVTTLSPDS